MCVWPVLLHGQQLDPDQRQGRTADLRAADIARAALMKTPRRPGSRRAKDSVVELVGALRLEDAEHDGAYEGECDIGGDNAQSADERGYEGHWKGFLGVTSLPA